MDGFREKNSWILALHAFIIAGLISAINAYFYKPMFNRTPTNVTFPVGDTAVLPCSVRDLGTKEVIWKKKRQKHVITVGNYVFIGENSYSIDHKEGGEDWNLVIKNVQKSHAGKYECQISTKEEMNITVTLNVIDPPPRRHFTVDNEHEEKRPWKKPISAVHISGPKYVEKGDPISLTCNATGPITPDDIDWFKDGKKVRSSASDHVYITKFRKAETKTLYSTLEIKHGEMSDSGTYICRSSDLEIESHNLMVLNASSDPKKRHPNNPSNPNGHKANKDKLHTVDNEGSSFSHTVHFPSVVVIVITQICVAITFSITLPT